MKNDTHIQLYWLAYIETPKDQNRPVKLDAILAQRLRTFLDRKTRWSNQKNLLIILAGFLLYLTQAKERAS